MDLFLEDDNDPQTLAFAAERNEASDRALQTPEFERDRDVIREMIERQDRLIVPSRRGRWLFDFNQTRDNPLGVWRRLPADQEPHADAAWETIFDLDAFCISEGKRWIFRGALTCPFEPTRVLLQLSDGGSDLLRLLEFDAETKTIVEGGFDTPAVRAHANWLSRDEICYFGSIDDYSATHSGWPRVGRRLKRGQKPEDAEILYEAADSDVYGAAMIIDPLFWKGASDEPQIRLFFAGHEIGKMSAFVEGRDAQRHRLDLPIEIDLSINHNFCLWRAKTDERFPTGTLVLQDFRPFADMTLGTARVLFSPKDGQSVSQFSLLRDWCVFIVSDRLQPRLFLMDLQKPDAAPQELALPPELQSVSFRLLDADLTLGEQVLQVVGQGFLQPQTRYLLNLDDRGSTPVLQRFETAPSYFDAEGMRSELLEATSADGTKVPYHLVLPKTWVPGELPVLEYGYGGFESSLAPYYSGVNGLWLGHGGAYVQAYIRGGGEFGPDWHRAAKRDGRHKAFEDFVAVARDLVERGYTKPSRIACTGGSNGGLLTAVMLTRYPQDFGAVWTRVPVIDMSRFHVFPAGRAWIDEYGNPDEPADLEFLLAYSPLHQVQPAAATSYPPVYVESSSNDDRVHPSHARRFAKRLEEMGHAPLFHEFGSGGHGGSGNSLEQAARTALGYSFLRRSIMAG